MPLELCKETKYLTYVDACRTVLHSQSKIVRTATNTSFLTHAGGCILCRSTYAFTPDGEYQGATFEVDAESFEKLLPLVTVR